MGIVRKIWLTAAGVIATLAVHNPAVAQSVEDFYKGRDVKIFVGTGISYAQYAQLAAKYLSKHIPGSPNLVVETIPGTLGLEALDYVYNAAPKDGSVLIVPHSNAIIDALLNPAVKFDASKFQYVGRMASTDWFGWAAKRTGIKSFKDLLEQQVTFGAISTTHPMAVTQMLFNRMAHTKIKIVTPFKDGGVLRESILRNEAVDGKKGDGMVETTNNPSYLSLKAAYVAGQPTDQVPLFTTAPKRIPEFPDAPSLFEFVTSPEQRAFLAFMSSEHLIGRSLAFPPGVPAALVAAFRKGFDAMIKDPDFIKEAKDRGLPMDLKTGTELSREIQSLGTDLSSASTRAAISATYKEIVASIEK